MTEPRVGILGATSLVGKFLIALLIDSRAKVFPFSRHSVESVFENLPWQNLLNQNLTNIIELDYWVCAAPIWVLSEYFPLIEASSARRIVVLSSTSRFTKVDSGDRAEIDMVALLSQAEERFVNWAIHHDIEWVILRPTLIYGSGQDKNISEIARFIDRFSFFPVFGKAKGLRQPIHAEDVAKACFSSMLAPKAANCSYNISGGETLTYREMVTRVFIALGRRPRFLNVPLWAFHLVLCVHRLLPLNRQWSTKMAERMNYDLDFDHADAVRDFNFKPRSFVLLAKDLPH